MCSWKVEHRKKNAIFTRSFKSTYYQYDITADNDRSPLAQVVFALFLHGTCQGSLEEQSQQNIYGEKWNIYGEKGKTERGRE